MKSSLRTPRTPPKPASRSSSPTRAADGRAAPTRTPTGRLRLNFQRPPLEALREATAGHQVQIDVKFIEPVAGARKKKYFQYTAIDDCTRLRVLRIHPKSNQLTAIQFLYHVLEKLPFQVEAVQTDIQRAPSSNRGSTGTRWTAGSDTSTSSPAPHD